MLCSIYWLTDGSGIWAVMINDVSERILMKLDLATGAWTSRSLPDAARVSASIVIEGGGKSIVFAQWPSSTGGVSIRAHDLETGAEKCLYWPDSAKCFGLNALRFSRDFGHLVFIQEEQAEETASPISVLKVLDMGSGEARTVYAGPAKVGGPAFSPDAQELLVFFEDESGWQQGLGLIPAAGGDLRRLKLDMNWPLGIDLHNRFVSLDWSPNGKQLALTTWTAQEETYLLKNIIPKERR
jgi:hypothetical protein